MKTKIMFCTMFFLLSAFAGNVFGGTEGTSNTFFGTGAGGSTIGDNDWDTFIGARAGYSNTTGTFNTFLGHSAGYSNTTGYQNTFLGYSSGDSNTTGYYNTFIGSLTGESNTTGVSNAFLGGSAGSSNTSGNSNTFIGTGAGGSSTAGSNNTFLGMFAGNSNITGNGNVFLGYTAGQYETASNRLYIDNSNTSTPLIYGEFDNNILTINGNLEVIGPYQGLVYLSNTTADNTTKVSRVVLNHYSNLEEPVYLFGAASTATNNYLAFGGGNTMGNAATQIDLYTAPITTTLVGTSRITIKGNGYVGIGTQNPSYPLQMAGGAYTNGSSWVDVSSREYKENIEALSTEEALEAIKDLNPVKYAYKTDRAERRVGFIAEDVPELLAMKDRNGLSSMDIVAVLTKVVQEQQKIIQEQQKTSQEHRNAISLLKEELDELKGKGR